MESENIDSNKQITQMNKNKLRYRGKKCDELRKVSISKANNLIEASHGIYKREDQICLQIEINRNVGLSDEEIMFENPEIAGNRLVFANLLPIQPFLR